MPTPPTKPRPFHVKVSNGAAGDYVKVTNLTSGGFARGQLNSKLETVVDLAASTGDTVLIQSQGKVVAGATATVAAGGSSTTISASVNTSLPGVNL